jgi:O-antigen/teichoic acid export membrane protein
MYRGEGDNARVKGTIFSALVISSTSSVLVAVTLFVLSSIIAQKFFHEPGLLWVLRVLALALPFYVLAGITTSFAQSFRRIDYQQGVNNIFSPLVKLTSVGVAFLLGYRLNGVIFAFLISGVLSAGLGFYFLWRIFPDIIISRSKPIFELRKLARFSLPMFLAGFCYLALHQTDRIMLGFFTTSTEVGIYSAASILAQQLTVFFGAFVAIFLPMISDLYNRHRMTELGELFKVVSRWIFITALPLAIIMSVFSFPLMGLFGTKFADGWPVLVILALSRIVYFSVGPVGEMLQMTGRQNLVLANTIVMLLANIGLNIWLIPLWGKLGAATATAISVTGTEVAQLIQVRTILRIHPFSINHIKPLGAAVAAAVFGFGVLFLVKGSVLGLILAAISVLAIYSLVIVVLGLPQEDKLIWHAIRERARKWRPS